MRRMAWTSSPSRQMPTRLNNSSDVAVPVEQIAGDEGIRDVVSAYKAQTNKAHADVAMEDQA